MAGFSGRGLAVLVEVFVSWFPNNLACNSLAHLSNIDIESLVLQRLWRLLNCQENELHAKFLGEVGVRLRNGTLVPYGCRKSARVMRGTIHRARRTSDARMTLDIVVTVRIKHYI